MPDANPQPKPTPAMNVSWDCKLKGLGADSKPTDVLPATINVGTKLTLVCEGPLANLNKKNLTIETNEAQKYALHLIEARELTETSAVLIVTPWRAGEWKLQNPALTDQVLRVGLGDQQFTVATVIDAKTNPEGKPFPPQHPLTLAWPMWLWLLAAAIGVGLLYLLGLALRKSLKRKKLLTLLEKNATALSPVNHLNKELRKQQRQIPLQGAPWPAEDSKKFFMELDSQFRWFLARELVIQALDGSVGSILAELKKADPDVYKHSHRDLRVALLELRKAQAAQPSGDDAVQLMDLVRKVADRIAKERNV